MTDIVGTVTVTKEFDITQKDIDYLISTAFEGGSNYWIAKGVEVKDNDWRGAKFASDVVSRGGTVLITADDYEVDGSDVFELTLEKILNGIRLACEYFKVTPDHYFGDNGDYDAGDADCMLQFAIFGEVVFG